MCFSIDGGGTLNRKMHRALGLALLKKPVNATDVHHRDGVGTNNRLTNLQWTTCIGM